MNLGSQVRANARSLRRQRSHFGRAEAQPQRRPTIMTCSKQQLQKLVETLHYPGDATDTRRALIFAAGVANNRRLLAELGSQETSGWYEGRRAADPHFENPYWPNGV